MSAERKTTEERSLHPAIEKVWLFGGLMGAFGFLVVFGFVGFLIALYFDKNKILFISAFGVFGYFLSALVTAFSVKRQFKQFKYQLRENDLVIKRGIWWTNERYIARDRIQHIDINSGPFDRKFGLVQMVVYAAGITGSVGLIPGLTPEDADWLKEELLASRAEEA